MFYHMRGYREEVQNYEAELRLVRIHLSLLRRDLGNGSVPYKVEEDGSVRGHDDAFSFSQRQELLAEHDRLLYRKQLLENHLSLRTTVKGIAFSLKKDLSEIVKDRYREIRGN